MRRLNKIGLSLIAIGTAAAITSFVVGLHYSSKCGDFASQVENDHSASCELPLEYFGLLGSPEFCSDWSKSTYNPADLPGCSDGVKEWFKTAISYANQASNAAIALGASFGLIALGVLTLVASTVKHPAATAITFKPDLEAGHIYPRHDQDTPLLAVNP